MSKTVLCEASDGIAALTLNQPDKPSAILAESEQFDQVAPIQDLREGIAAWIARRSPSFRGQ